MRTWEQRFTNWGAFLLSGATLAFITYLERDRFQHPLASPVGVQWQQERIVGGKNTVPIQYTDRITMTNLLDRPLENVELVVENWNSGTQVVSKVGTLPPKQPVYVETINHKHGFPMGFEVGPHDVVVIRCPGYADKRIPVKELGKVKSLRDYEKEINKENDADKDFWPKVWKWQDNLNKQGIQPTEEMFLKWVEEKEKQRKQARKS